MTDAQLERLAQLALAFIRTHPDTPYDTGNLKLNALQMRKVDAYNYEIFIEIDIAPYQRYLNERETVGGTSHRNRHQHWWEKMRVNVAEYLLGLVGDGYSDKIVDEELERFNKIIEQYGGEKA
jgi:hypothetical protein